MKIEPNEKYQVRQMFSNYITVRAVKPRLFGLIWLVCGTYVTRYGAEYDHYKYKFRWRFIEKF